MACRVGYDKKQIDRSIGKSIISLYGDCWEGGLILGVICLSVKMV